MTAGQGYTFGPYRFDPTEGRLTRDGNNQRKPARETGDYILRVEGNDNTGSGGGGFQCCWSNADVSVNVK